jgi:hypothetical protein
MAGSWLDYPFNEELFMYKWAQEPDPIKTAFVNSGVLAENAAIAQQIAGGSNFYTIPFYNTLPDTAPQNWNGKTDIETEETNGGAQSGVVAWRAKAWTARDFIPTFNSGADPMGNIVSQVARYWDKQVQKRVLNILKTTFAVDTVGRAGYETAWKTAWANHVYDVSASGSVTDANVISESTIAEAAQKACGDAADGLFNVAFVDSTVALNLAKKNLLEYRKYTDPSGIERQLNIADINGYTVIVDDSLDQGDGTHVSFLLGNGCIQYAPAPIIGSPTAEIEREARKNGGQDTLIVRRGDTYHVNGFSFIKPADMDASPEDSVLYDKANYTLMFNPKSIGMAKIVSNG